MRLKCMYISHTSYCSGWNMDDILSKFHGFYQKAARTNTFPMKENNIKMLDWDFRKPDMDKHYCIAKNYPLETIMAPDLYDNTIMSEEWALQHATILSQYCQRCILPIHVVPKYISYHEYAYPMGVWDKSKTSFKGTLFPIYKNVTHLLGASPHAQYQLAQYLPNIISTDGNQMFYVAVRFGKYWENGKWAKQKDMPNLDCFLLSLANVYKMWNK